MKKYRETNSACTLYHLVDRNAEHFIPKDQSSSNKRSQGEKLADRDLLLQKLSCPLNIKIEKKVYEQEREGKNLHGMGDNKVKKTFLKLTKLQKNFKNPWDRTASI